MNDMTDLMKEGYGQTFSDLTGYNLIPIKIMAIPDNFLDIVDTSFYFPNDFQKGLDYNKTNGQINAVEMLYSPEGLTPYPSNNTDPYNIITTTNARSLAGKQNFTWEVPILLPKGIEPILSQKVGTTLTLCQSGSTECDYKYRAIARSYLTKLPGFLFTGFKQLAHFDLVGVVSYPTYQQLMQDW